MVAGEERWEGHVGLLSDLWTREGELRTATLLPWPCGFRTAQLCIYTFFL